MKKELFLGIIISLIIFSGVILLGACASAAAVGQTGSMEAQVNTAVAATLIQYMVETKVAAQSVALASTPVGQAQATQPTVPTPTPVPSESAQPTVIPTVAAPQSTAPPPPSPTAPPPPPAGPTIIADQNTNCRVGPSTGYAVQTYFVEGSVSTVEGKDANLDWWYIASPDDASEFCWVWEGSTTVQGDTSTVPVVAPPSGVKPKSGSPYYLWNTYNPPSCVNYSTGYYPGYCGNTACCGSCVTCKPNQPKCNPNNWWNCNPNQSNCNPYSWWNCSQNVNCTCKPSYQNPCKKGGCPPVTEVNFKNYCKKYPQCCNQD